MRTRSRSRSDVGLNRNGNSKNNEGDHRKESKASNGHHKSITRDRSDSS